MKHSKDYKNGIITLLGCNTLWGVLPVYWQALRPIDSWVIIFYRIFLVSGCRRSILKDLRMAGNKKASDD